MQPLLIQGPGSHSKSLKGRDREAHQDASKVPQKTWGWKGGGCSIGLGLEHVCTLQGWKMLEVLVYLHVWGRKGQRERASNTC